MLDFANNSFKEINNPIVIIGNLDSKRTNYFQKTLKQMGKKPARVIEYKDLLKERIKLSDHIKKGTIIRIESPGIDFQVNRMLLEKGALLIEDSFDKLSLKLLSNLKDDLGRIYPQRQWYLGFCEVLRTIETQLAECPSHFVMNSPSDIMIMFDKTKCHQHMVKKKIPVPRSINNVTSYSDLIEKMDKSKISRAFIKLNHGSSASGVVAFNKRLHLATTTAEMVRNGKDIKFYNSKKIQHYRNIKDITDLINFLCKNQVHVEEWIPKAGIDDHVFDLRVIVIKGSARHVVVRMSQSPMTNLHVSNKRGDFSKVLQKLGHSVWESAKLSCEKALNAFPESFYSGVDLLISSNFCNHAILELNAFGDFVLDSTFENVDAYATEIQEIYG